MADPVQLTRDAAKKVAKVVGDALHKGPGNNAGSPFSPPANQPFFARLTGEDSGNPGFFSWIKQDVINGKLVDTSPAIQDTTFSTADLNLTSGLSGNVTMIFGGYDETSGTKKIRYLITNSSGKFPVGQFTGQILTCLDNVDVMSPDVYINPIPS